MKKFIILMAIIAVGFAGCATHTQTGTLVGAGVGAAVGAGVGQAIGRDTQSTLLGAGIGTVVGGLAGAAIGHYMDKQEQSMRQAIANSEAATMKREQEIIAGARQQSVDVLTVTFKSDYLFATNSSTLLPGAYDEVQRVANVLRQYPETNIQIAGHTDSTGSDSYNQKLSERRAEAVKNALVGMGVSPSRLTTIGYGESKPIASNNNEGGRQQNRRVEVRVIPRQA
ncbi:MAG TPA: OmpA family protein [Syntrophorhabdaceae bacterium]|nr:OmpA family protein [Syntrophorhabdaceae bacterium]